jgi:gamma-glutamylcyclotransferase (GGCT)/AIG2-like uncharacterized protein YtfP
MGYGEESALFVYGTLLDRRFREKLLGRVVEELPARLAGYARRRARYFYAVKRDGAETEGVLLLDLSDRDFKILDEYEEVPHLYTRERVAVVDREGRSRECWIYLPPEGFFDQR